MNFYSMHCALVCTALSDKARSASNGHNCVPLLMNLHDNQL